MSTLAIPRRAALPESFLLAFFCVADLIVTLWIVENGLGVEANPVMRFYYDISPLAFALAKSFLYVVPVGLLERFHDRNPRPIRSLMRATVVLYAAVYLLGIAAVNYGV